MHRAGTGRGSGSSSPARPARLRRQKSRQAAERRPFFSSYVPGPLDRGMLQQELLVDLEPEPGFLERPDVAVAVDFVRLRAQLVAKLVLLRDVAFEVTAVVDRGE